VLQLSTNDPKKQGPRDQHRQQPLKFYDPDKVAIEVVAFRSRNRAAAAGQCQRKMVESLVAQSVRFDICLNTVETVERDSGKRRSSSDRDPGSGRRRQILYLTENGYTLVRPVNFTTSCERSEAIHRATKQVWIASLRSQ